MGYVTNVLIAIDQVGTALIGGSPDETMSSYAYRMERQGKLAGRVFRPLIDWLFSWQKIPGGHCRDAWLAEVNRTQEAPEFWPNLPEK